MAEVLTPYQKRVQKEDKMRHFFTYTCNSGGLNELLKRYGLRMTPNGAVRDDTASSALFKEFLEKMVVPAIEKELGIKGVKVHKKPTHLTLNLFQWYKAEIVDPT